jgi:hypothetical protein
MAKVSGAGNSSFKIKMRSGKRQKKVERIIYETNNSFLSEKSIDREAKIYFYYSAGYVRLEAN